MDENNTMVTVRVSRNMYNGLKAVNNKLGISLSDLIRMGINDVLKKELSQKERKELKKLGV